MNTCIIQKNIKDDIRKINNSYKKILNCLEDIEMSSNMLARLYFSLNLSTDNEQNYTTQKKINISSKITKKKNKNNKNNKNNKDIIDDKKVSLKTKKKKRNKIVWNSWIIDTSDESESDSFSDSFSDGFSDGFSE